MKKLISLILATVIMLSLNVDGLAKNSLKKPSIKLKAKGNTITVSNYKVSNAKKYEINYKLSSVKKWKTKTTTKTKYNITKLKYNKKYSVKVRAINGSEKSKFSKTKTIYTKKKSGSPNNSSSTVYITETGTKYHLATCRTLKNSKIAISKAEAISQGYEPCGICKP